LYYKIRVKTLDLFRRFLKTIKGNDMIKMFKKLFKKQNTNLENLILESLIGLENLGMKIEGGCYGKI
jgi:hypothetical protein